jgi:uncharacterized protein
MTVANLEKESRFTTRAEVVEIRSGSRRVGGLAAVFNSPSRDLGGFREVVEPRAFTHAEKSGFPNVTCTFEHDPRLLLGTTNARTLELRTIPTGLDYTVDLPNTVDGDKVLELSQRGDLRSSMEFQSVQDEFEWRGGMPVRHLIALRLLSVSPVGNPAYTGTTTVALRSLARQLGEDPDEVFALAQKGELRSLFVRTDRSLDMAPTPLEVVAQRSRPVETVTAADAQRWLPEHEPAGINGQQAWLELARRKIEIDASDIAIMEARKQRYQPYGPAPDDAARQQAAEVLQLATKRRVNQLHEAGFEVHDTSCGVQTIHPSASPAVPLVTPRQTVPNDGWLGT